MTKPPKHLSRDSAKWFRWVVSEFILEEHHLKLLVAACESWDRAQEAREALAEYGMIFTDRFGQPRQRPEVRIEQNARLQFVRCLRELQLDVHEPGDIRPPTAHGNASRQRGR